MGVLDFIRDYLQTRWERKYFCKSREVLRAQLDLANHEKRQLLAELLKEPESVVKTEQRLPEPIMPRATSWAMRKQILEQEDRARAATIRRQKEDEAVALKLRESRKPGPIENNEISLDDLEKELGVD